MPSFGYLFVRSTKAINDSFDFRRYTSRAREKLVIYHRHLLVDETHLVALDHLHKNGGRFFIAKIIDWSIRCGSSEWRHVYHKQPQDGRIFLDSNGIERMKVYYPQDALRGITVFYDKEKTDEQIEWYKKFKMHVKTNHWANKSIQLRQFQPRINIV